MDHGLKGSLPPVTNAQFLAQLPELAEGLLDLSPDFEASLMGWTQTLRTAELMRGWNALERLARDSLMERAKLAAEKRAQQEREEAASRALNERPSVPRRTVEASIKAKAMKALDDPGVLNALKQWTQSRSTSKS